jgi:hypothetical protein
MILTNLDHWLGKTLFLPPIIKLCQLTRQSQFAVSRLFWFIAAMDGFYRADTLFSSIVWGVLSIIMMLTASIRAEMPTSSSLWVRIVALVSLAIDVTTGVAISKWAGTEFWLLVLIAEYAATIRTIPPREQRQVVKPSGASS